MMQRKWLRILARIAVAGLTLLALAIAIANWWGGRMKRDAIAELRAQGLPASLKEALQELPPDEENFGMIPILAQARKECWSDASTATNPPPGQARTALAELGAPGLLGDRGFGDGPEADLTRWKEALGLRGSDSDCLDAYDNKFGKILASLRDGLSRPETASPVLHWAAAETEMGAYRNKFPRCVHSVADGLRFRAELAISSRRAGIALESLGIFIRLSELVRSDNYIMGQAHQNTLLLGLMPTLRRALESGLWNEAQISEIRARLSTIDCFAGIMRDFELDHVFTFSWIDELKKDSSHLLHLTKSLRSKPMPTWANNALYQIDETLAKALPDGWFDANAAISTRAGLHFRQELGRAKHLREWVAVCERVAALPPNPSERCGWMKPIGFSRSWPDGLKWQALFHVMIQQSLLACDLESYRLAHGRYPVNLSDTRSAQTVDPMTNEPYSYSSTGDGYELRSAGPQGQGDAAFRDRFRDQSLWTWRTASD